MLAVWARAEAGRVSGSEGIFVWGFVREAKDDYPFLILGSLHVETPSRGPPKRVFVVVETPFAGEIGSKLPFNSPHTNSDRQFYRTSVVLQRNQKERPTPLVVSPFGSATHVNYCNST